MFQVSTVCAQDQNSGAIEAFEAGKSAFAKKQFSEAAESFREAKRLKPSWKLHYNIGQSEAAAKRYGLALEAFEKYLAGGGDEIEQSRQEEVREEIVRLRGMVGFLDVIALEGAVVSIDGVLRGTAPLKGELPVASSKIHVVVALVDGEVVAQQEIQVSGGRTASLNLSGTAQTESSRTETESKNSSDDTRDEPDQPATQTTSDNPVLKTVGWVSVGLGGALLIGGGVTGGLALKKNGELEDKCEPDVCYSDSYSLMEDRDGLATTSTILFVAGGVVAATGVVLLLVSHKKEGATLDVVMAPGPGSVMLTGRF
ncbi:MAG: tetratricopeptide repeat protein [Deltaproteobacteria bacterium]|nr:tetratricopeptide repeat protein [Deltaproteobacteria bacterium]